MEEHNRENNPPRIEPDDFARRFSLRAPQLMWFLGAGASASAGLPTAADMVWEFKRELYVSQQKVSRKSLADLSNPAVQAKLQTHIDSLQNMPEFGATDEYAALFEKVYPSEADRGTYINATIAGGKPSYGHLALATLMRAALVRIVWTTNFDPLLADACVRIYDTTGSLTTVDLDSSHLATPAIANEQWPIEVKLHGDFRSRRLKNTSEELRRQDETLRKALIDSCTQSGLVVVGYSGRDNSVMNALEDAAKLPDAFPHGLFWLYCGDTLPIPRVCELLHKAREYNIDAALVPIDNFDEILRDLMRLAKDIDAKELDEFAKERRWRSDVPPLTGNPGWPVVRLNALRVASVPPVCRRIVCEVGGIADVRAAITEADANIIATRTRAGVLAFGSDDDIENAFLKYGIKDFGVHTLETKRHRYDSVERGLLREALTSAIVRECRLELVGHRRNTDLLAPANPGAHIWQPLRQLTGAIMGKVGKHQQLTWREGVSIRLDWADDRLWVLIDPRIVFDGITDELKTVAADFSRERTVKRYNRELNALIHFWTQHLAGDEGDICALGIDDGLDAVFRLLLPTAFSRRTKS